MDLALVSPELRRGAKQFSGPPPKSAILRGAIQLALRFQRTAQFHNVRVEVLRSPGAGLRVFHPKTRKSSGALFWIHGGGYLIGRAAQDDRLCASTAAALGITVVSAEYRLSPRHPFPAALDDCFTAWEWLRNSSAALAVDKHRIAIGGMSAGGGLAACLVQRLHDMGETPAAQWLFSPMLDDRTAANRELDEIDHFIWANRHNQLGWRSYLNTEPGTSEPPAYAVAARRADLRGSPRTWIGVGDIDLFFEESRIYASRLRADGVDVTFRPVAGAPHGFEAWAPTSEAATEHLADAQHWLGSALSEDTATAAQIKRS